MGKWGYSRNGDLWCTTCGGTASIPCPEPHSWDPDEEWWADCPHCDVWCKGEDHDPTVACPDCGSDNADTYVEGPPMCSNCGTAKRICKRHPDPDGFWCKDCCETCNP